MQKIDLLGRTFGTLTVIESAGQKSGKSIWKCACICGKKLLIQYSNLAYGNSKSCGCMRSEALRAAATTHGFAGTRVYKIWQGMRYRCENSNSTFYGNYGGRGIEVCARWKKFEAFLADMGMPELDQSIDRINNDGHYAPENCRWANKDDQARNKRTNRKVAIHGDEKCLAEACETTGVKYTTAHNRLNAGFSVESALENIDLRKRKPL